MNGVLCCAAFGDLPSRSAWCPQGLPWGEASGFLLFRAEQESIVWRDVFMCPSSIHTRLGCFPLLAAVNVGVFESIFTFWVHTQEWNCWVKGNSCLTLSNGQTALQWTRLSLVLFLLLKFLCTRHPLIPLPPIGLLPARPPLSAWILALSFTGPIGLEETGVTRPLSV